MHQEDAGDADKRQRDQKDAGVSMAASGTSHDSADDQAAGSRQGNDPEMRLRGSKADVQLGHGKQKREQRRGEREMEAPDEELGVDKLAAIHIVAYLSVASYRPRISR